MTLHTVGYNIYPGYEVPVSITCSQEQLYRKDAENYYKIVYLKRKQTRVVFNGINMLLLGHYLLCLNEMDQVEFLEEESENIRILFFHPSVFRESLTFEVCNQTQDMSVADSSDVYYFWRFRRDAQDRKKVLLLDEMESVSLGKKLERIQWFLEKQEVEFWPCMCRTNILEILFYLVQAGESREEIKAEECQGLAADVISYLQLHYNEKITAEALAAQFCTNRTTLLNEFKKATGKTLNRYLIQMRLQIAAVLLKDTLIPITEICERTGFYDLSYFTKVFKKEAEYTPAEYRKVYNRVQ